MRRWVSAAVTCAVLLAVTPSAAGAVAAGGPVEGAVHTDDGGRPAPDAQTDDDATARPRMLAQSAAAQVAESAPVAGTHGVAVVLATIGAQASDGVTLAQVGTDVEQDVTSYYGDSTEWEIELVVNTRLVHTTPYASWGSLSTCTDAQVTGFLTWAERVIETSQGALGPDKHAVVYTPRVAACEFESISLPGQGGVAWVNGTGDTARWITIAHELGHALGLGDSNTRIHCGSDVNGWPTMADGAPSACRVGYEGDAYDVMGHQTGGLPGPLNAAHLDTLGLLTASNTTWVDGTQDVTIQAVGAQTGRRFIAFETNLATYYVEYRAALGRDDELAAGRWGCPYGTESCADPGTFNPGVIVHRVDNQGSGADSYILDAAVGNPGFNWQAADWFTLPDDSMFTTGNGVVSVQPLSRTESEAEIRVIMPTIPVDQIVMTADMTGDARADVYSVDGSGSLYLFPGTGTGRLGTMSWVGSGWGTMRVFAPGDWNSDGKADLVAADDAGYLWLYAGRNNGSLAYRTKIGNGWNGFRIVPAGDMNGDRRADLLAIDPAGRLWLYPGAGLGKFGARKQVGNGWTGFELYAAGDSNRDGRMDILSIDSNGKLWYYAGTGGGYFAMRKQVGNGWTGFEFASGADLNRDGLSDLLGRDQTGTLYFYPGKAGSGFASRVRVANGW